MAQSAKVEVKVKAAVADHAKVEVDGLIMSKLKSMAQSHQIQSQI